MKPDHRSQCQLVPSSSINVYEVKQYQPFKTMTSALKSCTVF